MKVAACQPVLDVTDVEAGWRRALALVRDAVSAGARLVVLPELVTSGYVFTSREEVLAAGASSSSMLGELADLTRRLDAVVVAGHVEVEDGRAFNCAVVVSGGEILGRYRKAHLWDTEKLWFTPGSDLPLVVPTPLGRVGVMICYDIEFPEWVRIAREAGAEIVAAPVNWPLLPRPAGALPLEIAKAQGAAGAYRLPIVIADRAGAERGVEWIGGSCVVGADGYLAAEPTLVGSAPAIVLADVDLAGDTAISERNDAFADRRTDLYKQGST